MTEMKCMECGMEVEGGEYHPLAACRVYEDTGDRELVRRSFVRCGRCGEPIEEGHTYKPLGADEEGTPILELVCSHCGEKDED